MAIKTAHTGCMNTNDNSMESLYEAINYRCDIAEVDVVITSDNKPVLNHNESIGDETGNLFTIRNESYKSLKTVCPSLILLSDFLEEARGKIVVNLDIKTMESLVPTAALVNSMDMADDVVMTGCTEETVVFAQNMIKNIRYMLNADNFFKTSRSGAMQSMVKFAITYGCGGININHKYVTDDFINYVHSRYMPVCCWTIDDKPTMEKFISLGADSITTRRPDILSELIQ